MVRSVKSAVFNIFCIILLCSPEIFENAEISYFTSPPTMIKQPRHEQLFQVATTQDEKDNPFILECEAEGNPEPEYRWMKNGLDFEYGAYDERISQQPGRGTLVFTKPEDNDEGLYQCFASNRYGTSVSNAVFLRKATIPYWKTSPENKIIAEGEDVQFVCEAKGYPEPKLQWLINGEPLEKASPNQRRKPEGNVLTIIKLEKSDTAVYQCNASNVHGYAFKNFYLNVLALPPTIIEEPAPLTKAVVTSAVTLTCRVFGVPKPDVVWFKEDQILNDEHYQVLDSGDLLINTTLVTDEGTYTCVASSKYGNAQAEGKLEIKNKTEITQPLENYEIAAGSSATFRCNAEADSGLHLKIYFLFNGQLIDFDQNSRMVQASNNSLTITKALESDSGIYTCVAKTELDSHQVDAILTVYDKPNPPCIINVQCDSTFATVVWQPMGDRRAPILSYSIQYITSFNPEIWEDAFTDIPAADTRYKVMMSPWRKYTFRIRAKNKIGESEPSAPSEHCRTPEDVPYKNPDKVMGKGTHPNNIVISWSPMPLIEHNAPGFFYKVYWKQDDGSQMKWNQEQITNWRQNSLVINNQPTFKRYRIKVEAHNRRGQAKVAANEVFGYSGEDVPREAPLNFRLLYIKDGKSAVFAWDPVSPNSLNGQFKGYKIQTWKVDEAFDEDKSEVIINRNVTEALVDVLRPYSRNIARICAFNDVYSGPFSRALDFFTPEGIPSEAPRHFRLVRIIDAKSAVFAWNPVSPNSLNGYFRGYKIQTWRKNETEEHKHEVIIPRNVTEALVDILQPYSRIIVRICAFNDLYDGPFDGALDFYTPEENHQI